MLSIDSILLKKERPDSTLLNLTRVKSSFKKLEKKTRITTDTVQNENKCDQSNKNDSMYKVLKLLKLEAKKNGIKRQRFKYIEDILNEWKEVASRLENIFFILFENQLIKKNELKNKPIFIVYMETNIPIYKIIKKNLKLVMLS